MRRLATSTALLALLVGGMLTAPSSAVAKRVTPVPGDPLTGSGAVPRTVLTKAQLSRGTPTDTVPDSAFALPAEAAPPTHTFEGTLTLNGTSRAGGYRMLKDTAGYSDLEATKHLPRFSATLVQNGSHLIPTVRGLRYTGNAAWNLAVGVGRAWQEDGDGGPTRASLPFALVERNANCVHNGVLSFLFDASSISKVRYQITAETCAYHQFDMWGQVGATYRPGPIPGGKAARKAYAAEVAGRLPTKPIAQLATDHPGADVDTSKFGGEITPSALSTYGFYYDGVNYVGGCQTRRGQYPFCGQMLLPSYSTAKSAFASTAMLRLAQRYGTGVADQRLTDLVPETAGKRAWSGVTINHALDMSTGNYTSAGFEIDEAGSTMLDFFLAEPYTAKMNKALSFPRKATPGSQWVYHTSDTFLATRALNNYLRKKTGPRADLFNMLRDEVLTPIGISPDAGATSRTDNSAHGVPFGGYGMFWTQDDIAKFAKFLNNDAGAVGGRQVLHPGLLADSMQQNPSERGVTTTGSTPMRYQNGFWDREFTAADNPAYTKPFHVPFMSGFGGITVAMMPNGSTYYCFSDNYEYGWSAAVSESQKLAPMASGARP
ncbi:beta-lactamase family protein [Streptomyces sparsogenes]|uniref:beta-lactamase family protein n=1 Tax=Streptomyces sparsogenes TaxID=67365 RepID=UPI000AAB7174|nr:beta-lactamase family protein [Streptomyces sparsogenes]